jgi:hypothetical protein
MSRAAFITALFNDPQLNSLGLNQDTIFHNYSSEERPRDNGPFLILRWGITAPPRFNGAVKSPESVRVWCHWPLQVTNDYTKIINVLDRVDYVVTQLRDVTGSDGYTLSFVTVGGRSEDLIDDGFGTITKNAEYQVHSTKN